MNYRLGIDIGSTTAKAAVIDENLNVIFNKYIRHNADIETCFLTIIDDVIGKIGDVSIYIAITGSAGMGISEKIGIPFVQEVVASAEVVKQKYPSVKTLIDIGGEDSKIIFFNKNNSPDIRMNGNCAGGTGAFIDQMASLMNVPPIKLNEFAHEYKHIYPIASRCGVFAKTDVQSLLSQKIDYCDISASIFHAVAIQTINALARGFDVQSQVLFAGGPFAFLPALKTAFVKLLKLKEEQIFTPEYPELLPAVGSAIFALQKDHKIKLSEITQKLKNQKDFYTILNREKPLFEEGEYEKWINERQTKVARGDLNVFKLFPQCFIGVDSGSTTTKMVVTNKSNELIFTYYANNFGNHIKAVKDGLLYFKSEFEKLGVTPVVLSCGVTGYGEDLIKSAFNFDNGFVETIAHFTAAKYFDKDVSFIMDIGGQDMKAMFIEDGYIQKIELNEACSSGCGSFIETFARNLGHSTAEFAKKACESQTPCDLGTRCTVFMNSKVKQFLKEGVNVNDISAGLAYSVIKNSLYKVLKLRDNGLLGDHIVVQGGSFQNPAIHKAFEKVLGKKVTSPDIPGLMGAFGCAILSNGIYNYKNNSSFLGFDNLDNIENYDSSQFRCKGCDNFCNITRLKFNNDKIFFTGNKCEKYFTNKGTIDKTGFNFHDFKLDLLFNRPTEPKEKPIATLGIPRVLNFFENYPFWAKLLVECGMKIVLSPQSNHQIYEKGAGTITSDNICFPAKLTNGHIFALIEQKVDRIFYPLVMHERNEFEKSFNSFNCPIVMGYPDVIKSAINPEGKYGIPIDTPTITFKDEKLLRKATYNYLSQLGVSKKVFDKAFKAALDEQINYKEKIKDKGLDIFRDANFKNKPIILLIGRPYHLDPMINQKVAEIITTMGGTILTEDSVDGGNDLTFAEVLTQWGYPNRIYSAAKWATQHKNVEVIQINSFGCGFDAIVVDEVKDILHTAGKNLTTIRVDEVSSPGSIKLRVRTLLESIKVRTTNSFKAQKRVVTKLFEDDDKERTILMPNLSDFYTSATIKSFKELGYNCQVLPPSTKESTDLGMKYTNNEICYPSILVIGDIIHALKSGKHDPNKTAIGITQTGGQCRASNYLSLIRKALVDAGFENVPVVGLSTSGIPYNVQPGFEDFDAGKFIKKAFFSITFGDTLSMMYYSTAVREKEKGTAKALVNKYLKLSEEYVAKEDFKNIIRLIKEAVDEFNNVKINYKEYPKVGIVGEIFIKYNEYGNHNVLNWLMDNEIEVIMPPLIDFFTQEIFNIRYYKDGYITKTNFNYYMSFVFETWVTYNASLVEVTMKNYRFYRESHSIKKLANMASRVVSLINQYGEGWLIPAEISSFAEEDINNIVCIQPFGCIANQVIAKGVEKKLKDLYPSLNMLYLDLDADTSNVNYINRLHFLVRSAKEEFYKKLYSESNIKDIRQDFEFIKK